MPEEFTPTPEPQPESSPIVPESGPGLPAPEEEVRFEMPQGEKRDLGALLDRIQSEPSTAPASQTVSADVDAAHALDAETRVEHLVRLAEAKGVPHAVAVAQKLNDFYALDLLHDELVEKFHTLLDSRGDSGL
jgi:hypothetical protein